MQKHVKNYMNHFGYGEQDFIPCEVCGSQAVDLHHVIYKSQGGSDEVNNIIALCRRDHESAHSGDLEIEYLKEIIKQRQ